MNYDDMLAALSQLQKQKSELIRDLLKAHSEITLLHQELFIYRRYFSAMGAELEIAKSEIDHMRRFRDRLLDHAACLNKTLTEP